MKTRIKFDTAYAAFEHQSENGGAVIRLIDYGSIFWYSKEYFDEDIWADQEDGGEFIYPPGDPRN